MSAASAKASRFFSKHKIYNGWSIHRKPYYSPTNAHFFFRHIQSATILSGHLRCEKIISAAREIRHRMARRNGHFTKRFYRNCLLTKKIEKYCSLSRSPESVRRGRKSHTKVGCNASKRDETKGQHLIKIHWRARHPYNSLNGQSGKRAEKYSISPM